MDFQFKFALTIHHYLRTSVFSCLYVIAVWSKTNVSNI